MLIISIVPLVCIVGLLMWALANPNLKTIGFEMFRCGLLVSLLIIGAKAVRLL